MEFYASLQTTFNQLLLRHIETCLFCFPTFQTMKNYMTPFLFRPPTIKDSNLDTPNIVEPIPTVKETTSEPTEYETMQTNAIAEKNGLFKPN